MSTETLIGGSGGTFYSAWTGTFTNMGSRARKSFTLTDPTFPTTAVISSVKITTSCGSVNNPDPNYVGYLAGVVNANGIVLVAPQTFIAPSDTNGPFEIEISRPGGGSWTFADLVATEIFMQEASSSAGASILQYVSSSLLVTYSPGGPTATTGGASQIKTTRAHLNGTLDPGGAMAANPVSYHFDWGLSTAYGNATDIVGDVIGSTVLNISEAITGLTRATTYHFRLVASTSDATSTGLDATFVTSGADTVLIQL